MFKYNPRQNYIAIHYMKSECIDIDVFMLGIEVKAVFTDEEKIHLNACKNYSDRIRVKGEIKNQHYVPQFYLRLFANADIKLETLDIHKKIVLKKAYSPKQVCSDHYFYSIKTGQADFVSQVIEDFFGHFENSFSQIHPKLLNDIISDKQLDEKILYELCVFVSQLWMRSEAFREDMQRMDTKMEEFFKGHLGPTRDNNAQHLQFMTDEKHIYGFANLFFGQKMNIYIATGERNFATSDNPVVEINPHYKKNAYGIPFTERLHYFVLNPRVLIEFHDYHNGGKRAKRKRVGNDEVVYFNSLRGVRSHYLYSSTKDDFLLQEYTSCRANYSTELAKLVGTPDLIKDEETYQNMRENFAKQGKYFKNNYEMCLYSNPFLGQLGD